ADEPPERLAPSSSGARDEDREDDGDRQDEQSDRGRRDEREGDRSARDRPEPEPPTTGEMHARIVASDPLEEIGGPALRLAAVSARPTCRRRVLGGEITRCDEFPG